MKSIYIFLGAGLILLGYTMCKKETNYSDAIYITGAEVNPAALLTVDTSASSFPISVTASGLVTSDITANLVVDTSLVATYNKANGKNYLPLPAGSYALSAAAVTIKTGVNVSDAVNLTILSDTAFKPGAAYMIPVTISHATGNLRILDPSRTIYIIANPVIRASVAQLSGTSFVCDFSTNNATLKNMSVLSYECRIKVNSFQAYSPYISTVMGIEETFLLRFGDVTIHPTQLQQSGGANLTVPQDFATNTWYHIALTYDGTTENIYVNGVLAVSQNISRTIDLTTPQATYTGGFWLGATPGRGRNLDGYMSEARVWSKALTQTDIINGMCGVDPSSPGLVGYWKLNGPEIDPATGTQRINPATGTPMFTDLSGNGHNATASNTVTWIPNVQCN